MKFPKFSAALVAVVAPVAVAGALSLSVAPASAAVHSVKPAFTPQCQSLDGTNCISASTQLYGPDYVVNGANNGKAHLRIASDQYANEDLVLDWSGPVWLAVKDGLISKGSFAAVNYPFFQAGELEFAPDGNTSGKCLGVASSASNGETVTKQPCGVSSRTLWVFDRNHGVANGASLNCLNLSAGQYCPVINGSDATFSTPEALSATTQTGVLKVNSESLEGQVAVDSQQWTYQVG